MENDPAWAIYQDKPWPEEAKVIAAMDTQVDHQVGEIIELLGRLGIAERTIIFFCSDNGAAKRFDGILDATGPYSGQKRSLQEGGIRVPFIAYWPGHIPADTKSDLPIYFPDVFATIVELAGAETYAPKEIDGVSFLPTLLGHPQKQKHHEYLYWEWPQYNWKQQEYVSTHQAVRHHHWKALRDDVDAPWQLFDLGNDPSETKDLAAEHPSIVERIDKYVRQHRTPMKPQIEESPEINEPWQN